MPKKVLAGPSAEEKLRAECPELYAPRTWLVLSMEIPLPARQRPHLHMVIDLHNGTCLAAHFGPAPLDRQVAALLDGLLENPANGEVLGRSPVRVPTDNKTGVYLGRLATWGLARRVHTGCHPACTLHPNADAVMRALATPMNAPNAAVAMDRGALAEVGAQIDARRQRYKENRHR